jgi:phosphatidate cytidylyltransferase
MDSANAASAVSQKKPSSLLQRTLSALALLPVVLLLVWWSYWSVAVVVLGLVVVGLLELYGAFARDAAQPRTWTGVACGLLLAAALALQPEVGRDLEAPALMLVVVGSLLGELARPSEERALSSWALTISGALYIAWLLSHFTLLRGLALPLRPAPLAPLRIEAGAAAIYLVLAVTWLQDTIAYFAGRYLGRHKMAPVLSPKKTWEGFAGGMLGSVAGGLLAVWLLGLPLSLGAGALLGVVGGVAGPLGDLTESWIKRQVNLKDAGQLIPGHGGLLDRLDSLLFTGPILYYLIRLLTGAW